MPSGIDAQLEEGTVDRKRQNLSNSESTKPPKRFRIASIWDSLSGISSFFSMSRPDKKAEEQNVSVFDCEEDEDVNVVNVVRKSANVKHTIVYLDSSNDIGRAPAGSDSFPTSSDRKNVETRHEDIERTNEVQIDDDDDVLVEKTVTTVSLDEDSSDEYETALLESIAPVQSASHENSGLIRTFEESVDNNEDCQIVATDNEEIQFLSQTPGRRSDGEEARRVQNEIIFLNNDRDYVFNEGSSRSCTPASIQEISSPTPDESASRSNSPNESSFKQPQSGVRDYWRRKTPGSRKKTQRGVPIRQKLDDSIFIQRVSQSVIHRPQKVQKMQSAREKYIEALMSHGVITAQPQLPPLRSAKKSASSIIEKAKNTIAEIRSANNTPSVRSRESTITLDDRSIAGQSPTPSERSTDISDMMMKLKQFDIKKDPNRRNYDGMFVNHRTRQDTLSEELRVRSLARQERRADIEEEVKKNLRIQGIALKPKKEKKKILNEEIPLPEDMSQLLGNLWNKSLKADESIINEGELILHRKDFYTLDRINWLNDSIINGYLLLIKMRSDANPEFPKLWFISSFFFHTFTSRGYAGVKRWTRKIDIFALDILLVPIHDQMHWCMIVVDMKNKRVDYYDSLLGNNPKAINAVKNYLQEESKDKKKVPLDIENWSFNMLRDIPTQENGSDCGVFSCQFAEYASRRQPPTFSQANMPYFRRRMVHELYNRQLWSSM